MPPDGDAAERFQPLRPGLVRLAYRMLGSIAEAEDVVQEAYIRWHQTDRTMIREPGAFLSKTVTRLCLDILKSARVKRETYIGPWLPEPVLEADGEEDRASSPRGRAGTCGPSGPATRSTGRKARG